MRPPRVTTFPLKFRSVYSTGLCGLPLANIYMEQYIKQTPLHPRSWPSLDVIDVCSRISVHCYYILEKYSTRPTTDNHRMSISIPLWYVFYKLLRDVDSNRRRTAHGAGKYVSNYTERVNIGFIISTTKPTICQSIKSGSITGSVTGCEALGRYQLLQHLDVLVNKTSPLPLDLFPGCHDARILLLRSFGRFW